MAGRETDAAAILGHIWHANGPAFLGDGTDQSKANGRVCHASNLIRSHAYRDEMSQFPLLIQHAHGSVTCSSLFTGKMGDSVKDDLQGEVTDQLKAGAMQSHQPSFNLLTG
jgi:hypothetical protein